MGILDATRFEEGGRVYLYLYLVVVRLTQAQQSIVQYLGVYSR
jgi:hypothetical protein